MQAFNCVKKTQENVWKYTGITTRMCFVHKRFMWLYGESPILIIFQQSAVRKLYSAFPFYHLLMWTSGEEGHKERADESLSLATRSHRSQKALMSTQPLIPEQAGKAIIGKLDSFAVGGVQRVAWSIWGDGHPHMGRLSFTAWDWRMLGHHGSQ